MTFPTVQSVTPTSFATLATSHPVAMPPVVSAGDLLVCFFASRTNNVVSGVPSGWTLIGSLASGVDVFLSAFLKSAAGTEVGTTPDFATAAGHKAAAQVYRITDWFGGTIVAANDSDSYSIGALSGSDAAPDPPWRGPAYWGAEDTLWLAMFAAAGNQAVSAYPTDFTDGIYTQSDSSADSVSIASARMFDTLAEFNPLPFTIAGSELWVASTLVIRPSAAASSGGSSTKSKQWIRTPALTG